MIWQRGPAEWTRATGERGVEIVIETVMIWQHGRVEWMCYCLGEMAAWDCRIFFLIRERDGSVGLQKVSGVLCCF